MLDIIQIMFGKLAPLAHLKPITRALGLSILALLVVSACGGLQRDADPMEKVAEYVYVPQKEFEGAKQGSIFGREGIQLFGGGNDFDESGGGGIGVNSFLWRASLDTVSFMPLASADPFGGVIITEWFAPPETPNERFKMQVYILDRRLRADGIRVTLFRQTRGNTGWISATANPDSITQLENAILTRARQLRINSTVQ
jgi:hypothetical protein